MPLPVSRSDHWPADANIISLREPEGTTGRANCARPSGEELALSSGEELRRTPPDLTALELVWVDIVEPDRNDIEWLQRTFRFHPLAIEDVARRGQRAKIEEYSGYYFGVVYAARCDTRTRHITSAELQFFWGPTYLVTIHSDPFPEVEDLTRRAQAGTLSPVVGAGGRQVAAGDLVYRLLDSVVD
jgi:Mg2+ and Co2+ transporter CorA